MTSSGLRIELISGIRLLRTDIDTNARKSMLPKRNRRKKALKALKDGNWSHLESEPMLRIELRGTPFSLGIKLQPTLLVLMPYKLIYIRSEQTTAFMIFTTSIYTTCLGLIFVLTFLSMVFSCIWGKAMLQCEEKKRLEFEFSPTLY